MLECECENASGPAYLGDVLSHCQIVLMVSEVIALSAREDSLSIL